MLGRKRKILGDRRVSKMDVSKAIKTAAAFHGMKLQDVAAKMGKDPKQFYNLLLKSNPTLKTMESAAAAVGCKVVFIDLESGNIYE